MSIENHANDYLTRMFGNISSIRDKCPKCKDGTCQSGIGCYYEMAKAALDRAHDIRKFELELLWKRTAYMATFQGFLLAALGFSLSENSKAIDLVIFFQVVICFAGVFTSFLWVMINKGSKFWHENWTHHIDFLEDEFEGRLLKTLLYEKKLPFSVSRANTYLSWMFFWMWLSLGWVFSADSLSLYFCLKFDCGYQIKYIYFSDTTWFAMSILLVMLCTLFFCCFCYCKLKTNFENETNKKIFWIKRTTAVEINDSKLHKFDND